MKTFVLLLPVYLFANALYTQTWQTLTIPQAQRFDDVFFRTPLKGWACNDEGHIYQTTDAGQTWNLQHKVPDFHYLRSIEFLNDSIGFCGGLDANNSLFRTNNGGKAWNNISNLLPTGTGGICGLSCPGNNTVYGCGVWSQPAYIIKSTDGGLSWVKKDMSQLADYLVDVFFITPDSGWVSGGAHPNSEGGIILSTSDGGDTWHVKAKTGFLHDYVWKIQTPDSVHFFASIERYVPSAKTQILKSTDGGVHWSLREVSPTEVRLQMIGFLDSLYGITGNTALFESKDGGETWEPATGQGTNYNRFWRIDAQTAIVSGSGLYRLRRNMTGVGEPKQGEDEIHKLLVSPNPSTGLLNISIDLRKRTAVWLAVFRADGTGVSETLWSGEQPPGKYRFSTDVSTKGSGSYLVWLKTNYGTDCQVVQVVGER